MSGLLDLVKPRRSLSRRKRADRLFAACGAGAVFLVVLWIGFLFASLLVRALPAMTAYEIALTVQLEPEQIPPDNPRRGNWRGVLAQAVADLLNAESTDTGRRVNSVRASGGEAAAIQGGGGGVAQSCHQKPKLAWQDRHRKCADSFSSCF